MREGERETESFPMIQLTKEIMKEHTSCPTPPLSCRKLYSFIIIFTQSPVEHFMKLFLLHNCSETFQNPNHFFFYVLIVPCQHVEKPYCNLQGFEVTAYFHL